MKNLNEDIELINKSLVTETISRENLKIKYPDSLEVLYVLLENKELLPSLRIRGKVSFAEYLAKWFNSYNTGYESRPSVKIGRKSDTVPDEIIKALFAYHYDIEPEDATKMERAHSVMMSLENLTGELLEEYLSIRLADFGWKCAWGSTIKAVDFSHATKGLLQVKNSDNSENSSSSAIRAGTDIQKWFRRFSRKKGEYNWQALVDITECQTLSEWDFRKFCLEVLKNNKKVMAVDFKF